MISLFGDQPEDFEINIRPDGDWEHSKNVLIEVFRDGILEGNPTSPSPKMKWDDANGAFATRLEVNEHQLASMAQKLNRGGVLRFRLNCRRSDLTAVGFINS